MKTGPTKKLAESLGVSRRHARRRKAEGSATVEALSDRERYEKARATREEANAHLAKIELAQAEGRFVDRLTVAEEVRSITEVVKSTIAFELDQLAVENEGHSASKQRENNRAALLRILAKWQAWAKKHE